MNEEHKTYTLEEQLDRGGIPHICPQCQKVYFMKWFTNAGFWYLLYGTYEIPEYEKVALMLRRRKAVAEPGSVCCDCDNEAHFGGQS